MRRPATVLVALASAFLLAGCTSVPILNGADNSGPGQRAGDYLKPNPYRSIVVEIDSVPGSEPNEHAVQLLTQRLQDVTGKTVEIQRAATVQGQGATHKYTLNEIGALERQNRNTHSGGDKASFYMLYLDGGFEGDSSNARTLGAAYRGSAVVMFKGNLKSTSKTGSPLDINDIGKPTIEAVEGSVIVHETGHILGLVDLGAPMQQDHVDREPSHCPDGKAPCGHSTNTKSVMYYAVESSVIGAVLGQNPPNDYDNLDRADLQALRAT